MANSDFYTMKEVAQVLGVDSKTVNQLMDSGKLQPVYYEGAYKFRKVDVDQLAHPTTPSSTSSTSTASNTKYSLNEVLRELQMEEDQLKQLIADGEIAACLEQGAMKFDRNEIERYKNAKQVDVTIVVEKSSSSSKNRSAPKPAPTNLPSLDMEIPTLDTPQHLGESKPSIDINNFYSKSQVFDQLQIEEVQLQQMLEDGQLTACPINGEVRFKKSEVDAIRNERMVESTMVVEKARQTKDADIEPMLIDEPIELLDDEAITGEAKPNVYTLSPNTSASSKLANPPVSPMSPIPSSTFNQQHSTSNQQSSTLSSSPVPHLSTTDYYTFEEALQILQISSIELKNWIVQRHIPAISEPNGNFKFRKQDIDSRRAKIESTVILPEPEEGSDKDDILDAEIPSEGLDISFSESENESKEKEFYSLSEAVALLQISYDTLKTLLTKHKIQLYRLEGDNKIKQNDLLTLQVALAPESQPVRSTLPQPTTAPHPPTDLCTTDEAIKILQIDQQSFKMMVARGELRLAKQVGEARYFYRQEILNLASKKNASSTQQPTMPAKKIGTTTSIPAIKTTSPTILKPASLTTAMPIKSGISSAVPVVKPNAPVATVIKPNTPFIPTKPSAPSAPVMPAKSPATSAPAMPAKSLATSAPAMPAKSPAPSAPAMPAKSPATSAPAMPAKSPATSAPAMPAKSPATSAPAMPAKSPLIKPQASLLDGDDEKCTIQEAMEILSLQKHDIDRLIGEGRLALLHGNFLNKSSVENLKQNRGAEITMMLPLDHKEEDDVAQVISGPKSNPNIASVATPSSKSNIPATSLKSGAGNVSSVAKPAVGTSPVTRPAVSNTTPLAKSPIPNTTSSAVKPAVGNSAVIRPMATNMPPAAKPATSLTKPAVSNILPKPAPHVATIPNKSSITPKPALSPSPANINWSDYCSQQDVLTSLQIEQSELDGLVHSGELKCFNIQGKQFYRKDEVESYKRSKMFEPTLMVGDHKEILDDDGDDMLNPNK